MLANKNGGEVVGEEEKNLLRYVIIYLERVRVYVELKYITTHKIC